MENTVDLMGKVKVMYAEAKELLSSEAPTGEDITKADALMKAAEELKSRAVSLNKIAQAQEEAISKAESAQPVSDMSVKNARKGSEKFSDMGDFLQSVYKSANPRINHRDERIQWFDDSSESANRESKVMTENVMASGGALVPTEFMETMQGVIGEMSIVQPRATVIRMRRRQIQIPVLDQTGTTAGAGHWFGGFTFTYTEEATEKSSSDASFRQATLTAWKLVGYTTASDELVDDSAISLADFIGGPLGFAGGVAWTRDYNFLQGNGAGRPLGVINAPATITVARTATAPPVQYTDIVNMMEDFLPSGRGVWLASQSLMSDLLTMQDNAGSAAGLGTYIWGNVAAGVPNTLMGMPIIFTEKLPASGSAGDLLLADFRYYLVGDRQAQTIESTKFDLWRYDKTSWRIVDRHDGQPWLSAPLTLADGTSQVSPFVILGAKTT